MSEQGTVELSGQRIDMSINAELTDDGFWDVSATSEIAIRSDTVDWVLRQVETRSIDKNVDMAMSNAMVNLMEQVVQANLKQSMETEIVEKTNEQV